VVWKAKAQVRDMHMSLVHKIKELDDLAAKRDKKIAVPRVAQRPEGEILFFKNSSKDVASCEVILKELPNSEIVYYF
jgi:hypothetical protein